MGSRSTFNRGLALLVAATFFMENLDATIIQTAAPAMARDFGVQPADLSVAMVAYLLAVGVGIPATAWLADRFGVRVLFLTAVVVFTVASLLCALAPTLGLLAAARVLQGIGGALMVPVGRLAVLRSVTPGDLPRRDRVPDLARAAGAVVAPALGACSPTPSAGTDLPRGPAHRCRRPLSRGSFLVPRTTGRAARPFDGLGSLWSPARSCS